MLEMIEDVIDSVGECVVVNHYTIDYHWAVKSPKGRTFAQIMEQPNVVMYLTGHFHPSDTMVLHRGHGAIEFVGVPAVQGVGFGLVTIDNGRVVYHTIFMHRPPERFIVTHPVPLEQLSDHHDFAEQATEVRVMSWAASPVEIVCTGSVNGNLTFQRKLANGADLYALPINLPPGNYSITLVCGTWRLERPFVIGTTFKGFGELVPIYQRELTIARFSAIPLFLVLLWILAPVSGLESSETESWIEGRSAKSQWLMVIFLGPNSIRTRILSAPKPLRISLFIALLWPLVLPHHFFRPFCGLNGYSFLCFLVLGGKVLFDEWGLHMTIFYLILVIWPAALSVSAASLKGRSGFFWVSWVFVLFCFAVLSVLNWRFVGESIDWPLLFVNPSFVIVPVAIQIVFWITLALSRAQETPDHDRPIEVEVLDPH
jgi:hypothetical protein